MIDTLFSLLPFVALTGLFFAGLSAYRVALSLRGMARARRQGILLNLARRAGPPVLVGAGVAGVAIVTARADAGWLALLLIGVGLSYGLTVALKEMRATTAFVTLARMLGAVALSLIVVYLGQAI